VLCTCIHPVLRFWLFYVMAALCSALRHCTVSICLSACWLCINATCCHHSARAGVSMQSIISCAASLSIVLCATGNANSTLAWSASSLLQVKRFHSSLLDVHVAALSEVCRPSSYSRSPSLWQSRPGICHSIHVFVLVMFLCGRGGDLSSTLTVKQHSHCM
jgi:hypothetical protein